MAEPASRLCPACGLALEEGFSPAACLRCQNLYHAECWEGLERCLCFGCAGSPQEQLSDLERPLPPERCSRCGQGSPAGSSLCPGCGARLRPPAGRRLFTSQAGWQAAGVEALVEALERHWEGGVHHLYQGDLEAWFEEIGREDLAASARSTRSAYTQHSVGLEAFLQSTGQVGPPQIEGLPETLLLEGPGPLLTASLEIRNPGRGYLSGRWTCEAPWLEVEPVEFAGNRVRFALTARLQELPEGLGQARLQLEGAAGPREVEVRVRRVGLGEAVALLERGETVSARALCRKLMDAQPGSADPSLILAAAYVEEDNPPGALQALRNMSGACQEVPVSLAGRVFAFLHDGEGISAGLERLEMYERLLPCLAPEQAALARKAVAALALGKVREAAETGAGQGGSLWQDGAARAQALVELLQVAESYDPALAPEARALHRRLRRRAARGRFTLRLAGGLLLLGALASGFGVWTWNRVQAERALAEARAHYGAGRFFQTLLQLRELEASGPLVEEGRILSALSQAQLARAEEQAGLVQLGHTHFEEAFKRADEPPVGAALAELLSGWAQEEVAAGRGGEARVHLELALQVAPEASTIQARLAPLRATTDLYLEAYRLVSGELGRQPLDEAASLGAVSSDLDKLARRGLEVYPRRMMVALGDVAGSAERELIVAGSLGPGGGRCAVYSLEGGALRALHREASLEAPLLGSLMARDLTGDGKSEVILQWLPDAPDASPLTRVVGYPGGRLVSERVPTPLPVDVADRDEDGRAELWIAEVVAQSTGAAQRVLFYRPSLWKAPGFTPAQGRFEAYYADYILSLKNQVEDNPYLAEDPRFELYRRDRFKAQAMAEREVSSR